MDTLLATITTQTTTLLWWGFLALCFGIVAGLYLKERREDR